MVTDGQPDSETMVKQAIIDATHKLVRHDELSVSKPPSPYFYILYAYPIITPLQTLFNIYRVNIIYYNYSLIIKCNFIIFRVTLADSNLTRWKISFIQIGNDTGATRFLEVLDDELDGAKQDIVDCLTTSEMAGMTFSQLVQKSLLD